MICHGSGEEPCAGCGGSGIDFDLRGQLSKCRVCEKSVVTVDPLSVEGRVLLTDFAFSDQEQLWRSYCEARRQGHALLSQGCGQVRCAGCEQQGIFGHHGDVSALMKPCQGQLRVPMRRS